MTRQTLVLGPYTYIVDVFDAFDDLQNETHRAQFVMLRNFTVYNEITTDRDIFFIDKVVFDELVEDMASRDIEDLTSSKIAWPMNVKNIKNFSSKCDDFNENLIRESLFTHFEKNEDDYEPDYDFGYDIYPLYDSNHELAEIRCNKCRIYHPANFSTDKLIIHIDNYINNIHFHYFCRPINNYGTNSETIFNYANFQYFEFVEFWFPNIKDLFRDDNDVYYIEDLDIVASKGNDEFLRRMNMRPVGDKYLNETFDEQFVPLRLLIQPFRIIEENGINVKEYLKIVYSIENNYLTHPFNITMYAYSEIDDATQQYHIDADLESTTNSFLSECKFSISSKLGFSNGKIALISTFNYPDKEKFKSFGGISAVRRAYEYYNNVSVSAYDNFEEEQEELLFGDINRLMFNDLTENDIKLVRELYHIYDDDPIKLLKQYKEMRINNIREDIKDNLGVDETFLGFMIQISSDKNFIHNIYEKNVNIKFAELDDFAFELNGIFDSWNELPEHLSARVVFSDRYIGTILVSNYVIIHKEWFKYMINDLNIFALTDIINDNKQYSEDKKQNDGDMKTFTTNDTTFNFLNNITCIVKNIDENNKDAIETIGNKPKILYRPIFYRVNDLQNVRIRKNVTQKIGINLADYMTKVETFKLYIDDNEITECGRNDIYVIFNINATLLQEEMGTYDIQNQDGEYISSGNWSIY